MKFGTRPTSGTASISGRSQGAHVDTATQQTRPCRSEFRLQAAPSCPPCRPPEGGTPNRGRVKTRQSQAGFTLAEVLAALLFMAIVIPVAVQGLRIASLAGEVAERKREAARVAERVLNESIVTTNWNKSLQSGTITEGVRQFRWTLRNDTWNQDAMQLLSVEVLFAVQDRDYSVRLSTLAKAQ